MKPLLLSGIGWLLHLLFWLILAILAVWLVFRLVKRYWKARKAKAPVKSEASHLREKWRRLSDEGLSGKDYCLSLSGLVRECLQFRFGFLASDMTTGEVVKALKGAKFPAEEVEKVERCLRSCDRVLYADGALTLKDRQSMRSTAGDLLPKG